jgi:HD-GYP domain-containing protein (c-di-GMP phosphodiesterase class II)
MRLIHRSRTVANPSDVLEKISVFLAELRSSHPRDQVIHHILELLSTLIPSDAAGLLCYHQDSRTIEFLQGRGAWASLANQSIHAAATSSSLSTDPVTEAFLRERFPNKGGASMFLMGIPLKARSHEIGSLWIGRDSASRQAFSNEEIKIAHIVADVAAGAMLQNGLCERVEKQQFQISAMRSVQQTITSSLDSSFTLNVFLDQVTTQLDMDAATVMVLGSKSSEMGVAATRGFFEATRSHSLLWADHSLASQACVERKTVFLAGARSDDLTILSHPLMRSEGFVVYYATPLIAHGQVKGVLEVFRRSPRKLDPEWTELFESLALQGAIAVENYESFENLQRTHSELALACDSTIEGWCRAVDLRAQEAEGHSLRVADLAIRLAEKMGIAPEQMTSIRRGSLLHDIGILGIPDRILWKPGVLTEEEWKLMREHPKLAENLLAPIEFLRPSMDIPRYHHERWDGQGYPYRLSGTDIPPAARLFSIVDVWDSMQSQRPFRKPWTRVETINYIREASGSQFDPSVVLAFLNLMQESAETV